MKKTLLLLSLFAFTFSNAQTGLLAATGYAPDFTVSDINGTSHTLYNYLDSGKVVVLEFLSVTCGHCQQHAAGTENSYIANGPSGTDKARFLGLEINGSTNNAAVANFATNYGVSFPIANDITSTIGYQWYYYPGYYVIYPDYSYTTICGANCITAQNSSTIEGLLNAAISAWVPPIYGCTDPLAINYDSTATIDNDSCDFTSYTITTVGMSFSPDTIICDVGDTINFILGGYHNAVEVSDSTWLIGGTTSNGGFSFGFGSTGMFIPDDCHTFYYVCQPHASMGMKGVIIAHHPPVFGCIDPTALNYDSLATIDDGSCVYCSLGPITGVNLTDLIHDRVNFNWDDMNSVCGTVDQIRIRYREVGTSAYSTKTMGSPVGNNAPCLNTSKLVLNLSASTQYEYDIKLWYQDGTVVAWHAGGTFTTAAICDNVINVVATPLSTTKTEFCWDSVSSYSFVRLKYRENISGSSFNNIGGFGVFSPTLCKEKNGLVSGTQYRVMWRTWCSATGGPYRSSQWDGPVIWDQLTAVVYGCTDGTAINYNPLATSDDGSCQYCIDPSLINPTCFCPMIYNPVCGCDGIVYSNSCLATCAGVTSWTQGPCSARIGDNTSTARRVVKITDLLGRDIDSSRVVDVTTLLYIYDDGTVEKKIILE